MKEDQQADAILETWFAGTEGVMRLPMYCLAITTRPVSYRVLPAFCRADPCVLQPSEYRAPYNADKPNKYTSRYFDEANGRCIRSVMV